MSSQPTVDPQDPGPPVAAPSEGRSDYGGDLDGHAEQLLDYLRVLYARRRTIATTIVLVMAAGAVYTFTQVPEYEARARLLIEGDRPNIITFKDAVGQNQADAEYYATQYELLRSRGLAKRTLQSLNVWNDSCLGNPTSAHGFAPGDLVNLATSAASAAIGAMLGTAVHSEPPAPDETIAQSRCIDALLNRLTVAPVGKSRLVDLKLRGSDPKVAAAFANGVAQAYIEQSLDFKFSASREAFDWLRDRLDEQRQKVATGELAIQHYRERNDAVSLEERQNIVVQSLADLNTAYTRAMTERLQKQTLYEQLHAGENDQRALDTFPAVLAHPAIQQLKSQLGELERQQAQLAERLGDLHPDMMKIKSAVEIMTATLRSEIGTVIESIRNDFRAAQIHEQNLRHALDAQKQQALALNRKAIDYAALQRDATSNRQIFESLLQRTKEADISSELKTSNVHIVDAAEVPRVPFSPRHGRDLLATLLAGIVLAASAAFGFEYLDDRIRDPEQIKHQLGLPFLGVVPLIPSRQLHGRGPLLNNGVPPQFSEALRIVRTSVLFAPADQGARTIVVTSAGPSEGKTVIASNLAIALAQAAHRVLLIDADMRRPKVHEMLACGQEPGLSDLIAGAAPIDDVIRGSGIPGLSVVTSGTLPPNPAELLGSRRFRDLLGRAAERYDWLVIDSPPVIAVADTCVLANEASGVVLVVSAEMNSRRAVRTAIERLRSAQARLVGVVLNRADFDSTPRYYSTYSRLGYGPDHADA